MRRASGTLETISTCRSSSRSKVLNVLRRLQLHLTAKAKESAVLWTLLLIVFLVGVAFIYVSHEWKEALGELAAEIFRDLGIAFCIAALIAFVIEVGLARKMFANGLDAIMRRTVPPEVWEEIRQRVISQPVIREGFRLTMPTERRRGVCIEDGIAL